MKYMNILNKYLNACHKSSPNLIFLYDPKGNLKSSYFLNLEEKINMKKYQVKFFATSNLTDFYLYFETEIRHKDIPHRTLIILSNDNPLGNINELETPPFYIKFLKKRAVFIKFDIQKYIEKHFKLKIIVNEILEKPLKWFLDNKLAIMYYRTASRLEKKYDSTSLIITNENYREFENFINNPKINFN